MYRYSKAAESPSCVYVKMRLVPGDVFFTPVEMHFLYDSKCNCVKYSKDGLACHEIVITDFKEHVNIEKMFTDGPTPYRIYDAPCFFFYVKSGNKRRRYRFEQHDEIIEYHKSYKWVVNLFKKICEDDKLINISTNTSTNE
jgi:hypothetical protein